MRFPIGHVPREEKSKIWGRLNSGNSNRNSELLGQILRRRQPLDPELTCTPSKISDLKTHFQFSEMSWKMYCAVDLGFKRRG